MVKAERRKSHLDANQADSSWVACQDAARGDCGICMLKVQLPLFSAIVSPLQGPLYMLHKRGALLSKQPTDFRRKCTVSGQAFPISLSILPLTGSLMSKPRKLRSGSLSAISSKKRPAAQPMSSTRGRDGSV